MFGNGVWKIEGSIGAPGNLSMSDTPPLNPQNGQMWWETDTGNLFAWFNDGDSSQWVQINVPNVTGLAPSTARNRIVNGAMQISQEFGSTGTAVNGAFTADQWQLNFVSSSTINSARFGPAAAGPGSPQPYMLAMSASPLETAAAAGEFASFYQSIEGIRVSDFGWGSAAAKQAVLAFDVNVPVAGTYWVNIRNTPTTTHTFLGSYTIAASEINTWVRKFVIIPLTAGAWPLIPPDRLL